MHYSNKYGRELFLIVNHLFSYYASFFMQNILFYYYYTDIYFQPSQDSSICFCIRTFLWKGMLLESLWSGMAVFVTIEIEQLKGRNKCLWNLVSDFLWLLICSSGSSQKGYLDHLLGVFFNEHLFWTLSWWYEPPQQMLWLTQKAQLTPSSVYY